jgi:hypothetical protein
MYDPYPAQKIGCDALPLDAHVSARWGQSETINNNIYKIKIYIYIYKKGRGDEIQQRFSHDK